MSHAIEKALERYGVELTRRDLAAFTRAVREGEPWVEKARECRSSRYFGRWVETAEFVGHYQDRWYAFVASLQSGYVITFTPQPNLGLKTHARAMRIIQSRIALAERSA